MRTVAIAARQQDELIDRVYTTLCREVVSHMSADQTLVMSFVHLLFCGNNIEGIGDHATHIAKAAYLSITGRSPEPERRRLDQSSTITGDDAL